MKVPTTIATKQIIEAFPEGKQVIKRLLSVNGRKIAQIRDQLTDVFLNPHYDEGTQEVVAVCIQKIALDPLIEERNRLKRTYYAYRKPSGAKYDKDTLNSVPILSLFSPGKLRRGRKQSFCSCPFHSDSTPSLCVYHNTNSFYCFSCHKGGDAIRFVQCYLGVNFKEAMQYIGRFQ